MQPTAKRKATGVGIERKLEKLTLTLEVKSGKEGKLFGSINTGKIADELAKQYNITVDKRKFVDSENITRLGNYVAKVELFKDVIAKFNIEVISL